MTAAITTWLAFVVACGALAWFAPRLAIPLAAVAIATLPASFMALGSPTFLDPPQGSYTVLGARIDKDVAIYVLLDGDPEPRYYVLPYSDKAANELQQAMDGTADGEGGVAMEMGADGSPGFAESAPPSEEPKSAEVPIIGGSS